MARHDQRVASGAAAAVRLDSSAAAAVTDPHATGGGLRAGDTDDVNRHHDTPAYGSAADGSSAAGLIHKGERRGPTYRGGSDTFASPHGRGGTGTVTVTGIGSGAGACGGGGYGDDDRGAFPVAFYAEPYAPPPPPRALPPSAHPRSPCSDPVALRDPAPPIDVQSHVGLRGVQASPAAAIPAVTAAYTPPPTQLRTSTRDPHGSAKAARSLSRGHVWSEARRGRYEGVYVRDGDVVTLVDARASPSTGGGGRSVGVGERRVAHGAMAPSIVNPSHLSRTAGKTSGPPPAPDIVVRNGGAPAATCGTAAARADPAASPIAPGGAPPPLPTEVPRAEAVAGTPLSSGCDAADPTTPTTDGASPQWAALEARPAVLPMASAAPSDAGEPRLSTRSNQDTSIHEHAISVENDARPPQAARSFWKSPADVAPDLNSVTSVPIFDTTATAASTSTSVIRTSATAAGTSPTTGPSSAVAGRAPLVDLSATVSAVVTRALAALSQMQPLDSVASSPSHTSPRTHTPLSHAPTPRTPGAAGSGNQSSPRDPRHSPLDPTPGAPNGSVSPDTRQNAALNAGSAPAAARTVVIVDGMRVLNGTAGRSPLAASGADGGGLPLGGGGGSGGVDTTTATGATVAATMSAKAPIRDAAIVESLTPSAAGWNDAYDLEDPLSPVSTLC